MGVIAPIFAAIGISGPLAQVITGLVLAAGALLLGWLLAPKPPKPEDGKVTVQESTPPRNFGYGIARSGGVFLCFESFRGSTLFKVQAVASHQIEAFVSWYLHDDEVTLKFDDPAHHGDRWATVGSVGDGQYGENKMDIHWRFGKNPEDNLDYFSEVLGPAIWPTTCRGHSIAQIALVARDADAEHQWKRFPHGIPELSAVCKFALVWDPRDDSQSPTNSATWRFSQNPVLCIIHWLCFSEFGYRKDYTKAILPLLNEWKAQADICDQPVAVHSGAPIPRYQCGGTGNTNNEQKSVLALLLSSCDGWLVNRGDGSCLLRVGQFQASGVSIGDDDINGFHYQTGLPDEDAVNKLDVQFNSPDHKYAMVECQPWVDELDQSKRHRINEQLYQLEWVQDYRQARRIAKREFRRLREPFRGSLQLKLTAINAAYERWIYCSSDMLPAFANRYIENRGARFDLENGGIVIDFVGHPADIEAWSPGEEGQAPPVLYEQDEEILPVPSAVTVEALRIVIDTGPPITYGNRLQLGWDRGDPTLDYRYALRWRVADLEPGTPGYDPGEWMDQSVREPKTIGTRYRAKSGIVDANSRIEVQMASVKNSQFSNWSPIVSVNL